MAAGRRAHHDSAGMHHNYGPVLSGMPTDGGEELRRSIRRSSWLPRARAGPETSSAFIAFSRSAVIAGRGDRLAVEIESQNAPQWALGRPTCSDLYEDSLRWDPR